MSLSGERETPAIRRFVQQSRQYSIKPVDTEGHGNGRGFIGKQCDMTHGGADVLGVRPPPVGQIVLACEVIGYGAVYPPSTR